MNYYWWRSNGDSGHSGNVLADSIQQAEKKVAKTFNERDIFIVLARARVKKREFDKIRHI